MLARPVAGRWADRRDGGARREPQAAAKRRTGSAGLICSEAAARSAALAARGNQARAMVSRGARSSQVCAPGAGDGCGRPVKIWMRAAAGADRKSVVEGKSVSVRVDLGGRRSIKKKTKKEN